ncbi:uncharacterized protein LOC110975681 [Acanthaster planci]|uniref:Uncharacterized protein LOC110975681 n=1 Tax=Acanthaster planci TaxID=133434 RepID=A0A8B7XUZ6_ACAPL|nr:uncharacterized protein LOC110975681 [Acanthaster planci]
MGSGAQRGGRGGGGQWGNRQQQRPGYGSGGASGNSQQRNFGQRRWEGNQSRPDNRMDNRQEGRGPASGQQPYGRAAGDNRNREGSYMQRGEPRGSLRGSGGQQQRGGANMRRPGQGFRPGSAGGGRGRGGGSGGGGGWSGQGSKDQYSRFQQTPKTGRGGRMGARENQGRHSRSFTR